MWDDEDHFFYDLLCLPSGETVPMKIRSMVGLLPVCAAAIFPPDIEQKYPLLMRRIRNLLGEHDKLHLSMTPRNESGTALLSIMDEEKLRHVVEKMFDEDEFLSPFGIRSISRYHEKNPYV